MKPLYFLFLIFLFSCGKTTVNTADSGWKDSLIAENKKLKKERDSLESMLGSDCFVGSIIRHMDQFEFGDTAKFDFCPVYRKSGIADYFHYAVQDRNPFTGDDEKDHAYLDSIEYNDSIPINLTFPNRINVLNYKRGTNYIVGYFIMPWHGKHLSRLYCSTPFVIK